jgi:hypothetical protein
MSAGEMCTRRTGVGTEVVGGTDVVVGTEVVGGTDVVVGTEVVARTDVVVGTEVVARTDVVAGTDVVVGTDVVGNGLVRDEVVVTVAWAVDFGAEVVVVSAALPVLVVTAARSVVVVRAAGLVVVVRPTGTVLVAGGFGVVTVVLVTASVATLAVPRAWPGRVEDGLPGGPESPGRGTVVSGEPNVTGVSTARAAGV